MGSSASPGSCSLQAASTDPNPQQLRHGRQRAGPRGMRSPTAALPGWGLGADGRLSTTQVGPRGTLQVQVQPAGGQACRRGQVVDPEEDRPLLPTTPPPGPEALLPGAGVALPGARVETAQDP